MHWFFADILYEDYNIFPVGHLVKHLQKHKNRYQTHFVLDKSFIH